MLEQAYAILSFILWLLWKILVLISFPLLAFFSSRGYRAVFPLPPPSPFGVLAPRREMLWSLLWILSLVALGVTWLKALDKRLVEFVVSALEALGFTPPA